MLVGWENSVCESNMCLIPIYIEYLDYLVQTLRKDIHSSH